MDLLRSTSLTPPRLQLPVVVTSAGSGERWTSEAQAAHDLELMRQALERVSWPPLRDLETREWRERVCRGM